MVSQEKLRELKIFAADIRIAAIKSIQSIGVGHVGGSMSVCDLMACLCARMSRAGRSATGS